MPKARQSRGRFEPYAPTGRVKNQNFETLRSDFFPRNRASATVIYLADASALAFRTCPGGAPNCLRNARLNAGSDW